MYFITVFTKYERDGAGVPSIGSARTVGYYTNKKDAVDAVIENCCDIWEYTYDYAVVELIEPGLYNPAEERWFFKWNDELKGYEEIEPFVDCFGNYAFG